MTGSEAVSSRSRSTTLGLTLLALAAGLGVPERARSARAVEPIRFARGASSAEVRGAVVRGERALYSLEARGGQRMSLRIAAVEGNAAFQVYVVNAESGFLKSAG